jgi:hypothetical protein
MIIFFFFAAASVRVADGVGVLEVGRTGDEGTRPAGRAATGDEAGLVTREGGSTAMAFTIGSSSGCT